MPTDDVLPDEHSGDVTPVADEEVRFRQRIFDTTKKRADSGASLPSALAPQLRHHASGSLTKLNSTTNPSQSSFTQQHPPTIHRTRSRGDTLRSIETTTSPSSRTSLDKAISGFLRSTRSEEQLDPALQRALDIRAARQAYAEREEAKELKAHAEEARRARKQSIKEERARRKSDAAAEKAESHLHHHRRPQRQRAGTASSSGKSSTHTYDAGAGVSKFPLEKDESLLLAKAYADTLPAHAEALPTYGPRPAVGQTRTGSFAAGQQRMSGKSRWLSFVAWFRTRLLRVSRGMRVSK